MSPIERAARALAKDEYPEQPSGWHDVAWREYVPTVQAVLQAIREPSKAMVNAAAVTPGMREIDNSVGVARSMGCHIDPASLVAGSPVEQAFRAMIDALLAEGA